MNTLILKISRILLPALALLTLPPVAGCDPDDDFGAGDIADRGGNGSTIKFNTPFIDGFGSLDGLDTTGALWNGVRLKAVYLVCPGTGAVTFRKEPICPPNATIKLDKVWSDKGQLRGNWSGITFYGDTFLNSEWHIQVYQNGQFTGEYKLVIRDYRYDPDVSPYWLYWFNHNGLLQTCQNDAPGEQSEVAAGGAAFVLGNISVDTTSGLISNRLNTVYLACQNGAVGKAVKLGYLPSKIGTANFTTAVRVIRADYCGDGVSWTEMGTQFELRDIWGIEDFDPNGVDEAVWDAHGARCLSKRRVTPGPNVPVLCKPPLVIVDDETPVPPTSPPVPLPDCHDTNVFPTFPTGNFWTKVPPPP